MDSIVNYFGNFLAWDVLVQGFFVLLFFIVGLYLIVTDHFKVNDGDPVYHRFVMPITYLKDLYIFLFYRNKRAHLLTSPQSEKQEDENRINYLLAGIGLIIMAYSIGIIANTAADKWIDAPNNLHFGLKHLWVDRELYAQLYCKDAQEQRQKQLDSLKMMNIDYYTKLNQLDNVFADISVRNQYPNNKTKRQVYYHAKHILLAHDNWKSYLQYTQNLINLTQVFSLSFLMLLSFALLNFFSVFYRSVHSMRPVNNNPSPKIRSFLNTLAHYVLMGALTLTVLVIIDPLASIYTTQVPGTQISFSKIAGVLSLALTYTLVFLPAATLFFFMYFSYPKQIFISVLFIYFSLSGYLLSSRAWYNYELEVCAKTYGVFRTLDPNIQNKYLKPLTTPI